MSNTYTIRNLHGDEVQQMVDQADTEGWNPGRSDAHAFYLADKNGFFAGFLGSEPVAYISAVNYNGAYGFVGLYIVREEFRGQGYGLKIWEHALKYLGNMICGLDGVPAQIQNYKRSGFAYGYRQMRLYAPAISLPPDRHIYPLAAKDIEKVQGYDASVFGTTRISFLKAWLEMDNAAAFYAEANGHVKGYAVLRACTEGYKIGPLFADDPEVAEQLFLACHNKAAPGAPVFIDMSETNTTTHILAKRYNMQLVFETARMYKNGIPSFPREKVYGVTTFELG